MKALFLPAAVAILAGAVNLPGAVPTILNYQGRIVANGTNFNGTGQFKFALVNANGTAGFWNNSGAVSAVEPATAVSIPVVNGLYSTLLGDTNVANMAPIATAVFNNADVRLRVWFNNGVNGFQLLTPDQRLAAVGYAVVAATVSDGAITSAKLGPGAVTAAHLANGAITAAKLAPGVVATAIGSDLNIGTNGVCGRIDVYSTDVGTPGVTVDGCASQVSAYLQATGGEGARLKAMPYGGEMRLFDERTNVTVVAGSSATEGGYMYLYNGDLRTTVYLDGHDSSGAGRISVRNTNGIVRAEVLGQDTTGGGALKVYDGSGSLGVEVLGAETGTTGGKVRLRQADGRATVSLDGDASGGGGWIALYNDAGVKTIELDAKANEGKSRITTHVLEITGGSDLSENFEIEGGHEELAPGTIVSIDPDKPGHLRASRGAYDSTVAGIISGAGGIDPGMLMGQRGSKADGKYPVALTGRVYCKVSAERGAIRPGDLITTSDIPGCGMRVSDPARAQGAVIGKAMTSLASGVGLVLVLVSLQ